MILADKITEERKKWLVAGRTGKSVRSIQTGSIQMGKCRRNSGFAKDSSDVRTFWCQHGLSVKRRVRGRKDNQ